MKYLVAIPIAVLLLIAMRHSAHSQKLDAIHNQIATIYRKAAVRERKQWQNRAARKRYQNADHFYIDNHLETLSLLQEEVDALNLLLQKEPQLPIQERFQSLTEDNRLTFTEGSIQQDAQVQETLESLARPVECDTTDLFHILARLDDPMAPQLLVTDLHLTRNETAFSLDLKLLKREFL